MQYYTTWTDRSLFWWSNLKRQNITELPRKGHQGSKKTATSGLGKDSPKSLPKPIKKCGVVIQVHTCPTPEVDTEHVRNVPKMVTKVNTCDHISSQEQHGFRGIHYSGLQTGGSETSEALSESMLKHNMSFLVLCHVCVCVVY